MSHEAVTCEAVEAALIEGRSIDAYANHVAGCPACRGLISMTHQIHDAVAETPHTAGQKPQWLAELHARRARRRKQLAWTTGSLAATACVALVAMRPWSSSATKPAVAEVEAPRAQVHDEPPATAPRDTSPTPTPGFPGFPRPSWVISDVPMSGYCTDRGPIQCVGVSSYRLTKDDGRSEARDVALEAVSLHVALLLKSEFFTQKVRPAYEPSRRALRAAYDAANDDRDAYRRLADALHRAAVALTTDAGNALPPRESDWYFEEYAAADGKGTELMVWVRYDLSATQLEAIVGIYRDEREKLDRRVVTAFPLLAFPFDDFRGGVLPVDGPVTRDAVLPR